MDSAALVAAVAKTLTRISRKGLMEYYIFIKKKKLRSEAAGQPPTALEPLTLQQQRDLTLKHTQQRGVQVDALQPLQQPLLLLAGLLLGVETVGHQSLLAHACAHRGRF